MKIEESLGYHTQRTLSINSISQMLEGIAQELAPQYDRNLMVKHHIVDCGSVDSVTYIEEEGEEIKRRTFIDKILFRKKSEGKIIFMVNTPSSSYKDTTLHVRLIDDKAEKTVKKYLKEYAKEHDVEYIDMKRGY